MAEQEGFEIYNRFYPAPERFRMGDPVLVREVTGMDWPEFATALDAQDREIASLVEQGRQDEFEADHVLMLGLMAVAFWQGNQQMSRAKVVKAVERIPLDDVKLIGGDEVGDADPPVQAATDGAEPLTTSSESAGSPEVSAKTETPPASTSDETSPNGSGLPGLPSAPLESHPA